MRYIKLNKNWNAEPNAPESSLSKTDDGIKLTFVLNSFMFQHIVKIANYYGIGNFGEDQLNEMIKVIEKYK